MANAEACQKVLDEILAHPEQHEQDTWEHYSYHKEVDGEEWCGTVRCVAGWATHLYSLGQIQLSAEELNQARKLWGRDTVNDVLLHQGSYHETGAVVLGLDPLESRMLFGGTVEKERCVKALKELVNGSEILDEHGEWLVEP